MIGSPRILVVRRDNIGDLVCTTPLFSALRRRFPEAWIGAWVNSYNAPVLEGNSDLNEIVAYTKLKHLDEGQSAFVALRQRIASLWSLRRMNLDHVLLATPDFVPRTARLARWLAPKQIIGFSDGSATAGRMLDRSQPTADLGARHEVERVFALVSQLGIEGAPPPLKVVPDPSEVAQARARFAGTGPKIALHVSARRPAQRWPAERFAALAARLQNVHGGTLILLWSPGTAADPRHPGDDEKAHAIVAAADNRARLIPYPTARLRQLIGALAACDAVICSDGGASHLAAALGKPMVCFFGDASPERWRPWGVPSRLLQPPSKNVADVTVDEAAQAFASVAAEAGVLRAITPR